MRPGETSRQPPRIAAMRARVKMISHPHQTSSMRRLSLALLVSLIIGCRPAAGPMDAARLRDFAAGYTAAWGSQDAARVASFFEENGSLTINRDAPAIGRKAITASAQRFMTAFPDLVVRMDTLEVEGDRIVYRWTLTG